MPYRPSVATFIVLTALVAACHPTPEPAPDPDGYLVLLQFDDRGGEVLRAAATASVPADALSAPHLTLAGWAGYRPGTEEIIVALHGDDGGVLERHGYPLRGVGFHDRLETDRGLTILKGGPVLSRRRQVRVLVPRRADAAFATFTLAGVYRPRHERDEANPGPTEIRETQRRGDDVLEYRARRIASLALKPKSEPVLMPLSAVVGAAPGGADPHAILDEPPFADELGWEFKFAYTNEKIHDGGSIVGQIRVVILGEGFQGEEIDSAFRPAAAATAEKLFEHEPFRSYKDATTIYRIDTPSTDSHVDYCPARCDYGCPDPGPDPKDTVFEIQGYAQNRGSCTNFKTDSLETIYDVTATVIDPATVDLWIVLVNCDHYGARAHDDEPIVFMGYIGEATVDSAETDYDEMLAHEIGHVLGFLGEEYVSGALPCPDPIPFHNVASLEQVDSETVPWQEMSGLTAAEFYRGHPEDCRSDDEGIGLFEGATYIEDEDCRRDCPEFTCDGESRYDCIEVQTAPSCDERGDHYFRPTATCLMKTLAGEYCEVCMKAMDEALRRANRPILIADPWRLIDLKSWPPS